MPITVASKPEPNQPSGVQVNVWSQTNLMLNTACSDGNSVLVQWWERMGRRYEADTTEGWREMLLNTVVPALEKAEAGRAARLQRGCAGCRDRLAGGAGEGVGTVRQEVKRLTGGDFFCGPTFSRGSNSCPPVEVLIKDVDYTDPGIQQARNDKQKAIEQASALVAEARAR